MMKDKIALQLIILFVTGLSLWSCSDETEKYPVDNGNDDMLLNIQALNAQLPATSKCVVYIFSKTQASDPFKLKDSVHLSENGRRVLPYIANNWQDNSFRFLFISVPAENSGIELKNLSGNDLVKGTDTWDQIRITTSDPSLVSGDCYFGIVDDTPANIASTRVISGQMKRFVGQMVIDIYRGKDTDNAEDIINSEVFSVLDRVKEIEITYSGLSNAISFDESGNIQTLSTHGSDIIATYPIVTQDDFWRVPVTNTADENNPFLTQAAVGTLGSVRIGGIFGFPANETVRVNAVFRYYDTTAHCGLLVHTHDKYCHEKADITQPLRCTLAEHTHTQDCGYDQRSIVLKLPKGDESELLSIMPNMYTVNKAAINYDRIIDVTRNGDFSMAIDWVSNN